MGLSYCPTYNSYYQKSNSINDGYVTGKDYQLLGGMLICIAIMEKCMESPQKDLKKKNPDLQSDIAIPCLGNYMQLKIN